MTTAFRIATVLAAAVCASGFATAHQDHPDNPCNPCGGKASPGGASGAIDAARGSGRGVYHVDDPMGRNTVTFTSEAPLEDIIGTTNRITGRVVFDPRHPERGLTGEFRVPVKSLRTGIPLRDEHLQSADWLDAERYPEIVLSVARARDVRVIKSGAGFTTFEAELDGTISIRGVTRRITFPARITAMDESEATRKKMPGDLLVGRASFDVLLSDFGIDGPRGAGPIGTKVGDTIGIEVSVVASNQPAGGAANPCDPCGGAAKTSRRRR